MKVTPEHMGRKLEIYSQIFHNFFTSYRSNVSIKEEKEARKKGSWVFIPNSFTRIMDNFIELSDFLKKNKKWSGNESDYDHRKFLDAGCGVGNIMVLANEILQCKYIHGLEIDKENVDEAKNLLKRFAGGKREYIEVFKKDILKFQNYGDYDIIYYYCPLCNFEMEKEFEEMVEDQMKVGAVLAPYYKNSQRIEKDKRFKIIINGYEPIYMKVKK
jgi:SAM-dependent methyltransferase